MSLLICEISKTRARRDPHPVFWRFGDGSEATSSRLISCQLHPARGGLKHSGIFGETFA
jgi:hypothetical protein